MGEYLLAHDIGTSGNKATLFTAEGELVKSCVISYDAHYFRDTWWNRMRKTGGEPYAAAVKKL